VPVDGGVELVVGAQGLQEEVPRGDVHRGQGVGRDACLARLGRELQRVTGSVGELEATRVPDSLLERVEAWYDVRDVSPDGRVVLGHPEPVDRAVRRLLTGRGAEQGVADPADDLDLAAQVRGAGQQLAAGGVHHAHRVLDRDELLAGRGDVALGAAQAGQ